MIYFVYFAAFSKIFLFFNYFFLLHLLLLSLDPPSPSPDMGLLLSYHRIPIYLAYNLRHLVCFTSIMMFFFLCNVFVFCRNLLLRDLFILLLFCWDLVVVCRGGFRAGTESADGRLFSVLTLLYCIFPAPK